MKLLGKSLLELKELVSSKKLSTDEVWDYFGKRIEKYDKDLNSYVTKPEEILRSAQNDKGFPIAIKDNFTTRGIKTTASSNVLKDFVPPYSATVVEKLYNSGFSTLGKTNMDAWAHGSSTETSDFGVTHNPADHSRVAGGSSGGSAAAMAAYLAPATIGSETAGSIRQPSAWCGTVGLKPTYGRVSRYGVIAMGSSWDCPGPITRTVEDSAYLLSVLAGKDQYDATSSTEKVPDYQKEMKAKRTLKIGVARSYFEGLDSAFAAVVEKAIDEFRQMGHEVKDVELLSPKFSISVYTILQRAEVSSNLSRFDGIRYGNNRSEFGTEAKRRIMLGTYTLSHGYYDAYYKKAEKARMLIVRDFKKAFEDVDVIVGPTTPCPATKIGDMDKYPFFGELMDQMNEPGAAAGIPAISIPVGMHEGLPVGMQIMGNHFDESTVLNAAYGFETKTNFYDVREEVLNKYPEL